MVDAKGKPSEGVPKGMQAKFDERLMKPTGKILKNIGNMFSPNDPELVEKTLERLSEQDLWNDVFSTKLIETLDALDGMKAQLKIVTKRSILSCRLAIVACSLAVTATVWALWFAVKSMSAVVFPTILSWLYMDSKEVA